ncbi:MAG: hypothetical protein GAK37_00545 [Pseudomonas sp.]|nr:MAG: hypothetical protein GAK37_00545 [Pseudomonas sp.]
MHTVLRLLLALGICCLPLGAAQAVVSGQIEARLVISSACQVTRSANPPDRLAVNCGPSATSARQFIVSTRVLPPGVYGERVSVTLAW